MISSIAFIQQSLEIHLFFARIMKEHSFFLEIGFTPKNTNHTHQADMFRVEFDRLLADTIAVSSGVIRNEVIKSHEIITPYTLRAEMASSYFTGVKINTNITKHEETLWGNNQISANYMLEQRVSTLNERAIELLTGLIHFKSSLLSDVLSCRIFTVNYPLLIDHILREAKLYLTTVQKLQRHENMSIEKEAYEQECFWNRIMAEHAKFIRGLLDPTEEDLISTANNFGKEFDQLTTEAKEAIDKTTSIAKVTDDSLKATKAIRDFKVAGTEGVLNCKIRSIIIPLLGDHVLREANHYLRLLNVFEKVR